MCDHTNPIFVIDTDGYNTEHVVKKTYVSKTAGSEGTEYEILNLKPTPTPTPTPTPLNTDDSSATIPGNVLHYRSVVCREGRLLSMGVPKGIELADFTAKYPVGPAGSVDTNNLLVSEIIEGTMINLFYDEGAESWEIATKGAVGGNYWYFRTQYPSVGVEGRQLTFRQMFLEACGVVDLEEWEMNGCGLNNIPFLSSLDRNMVYSFVLQHPLNHIVLLIDAPTLYLVGMYRRCIEGTFEYISPLVYQKWPVFSEGDVSFVRFPKHFDFQKGGYLTEDFRFAGVMITCLGTGERYRLDNPAYLEALRVRGNHPTLQYHFLTLLKGQYSDQCIIDEFLDYFPWYGAHFNGIFGAFYRQFTDFARGVYRAYVDRYIRKVIAVGGVPKQYMPHIWRLHHGVYLPSVAGGAKMPIQYFMVENYLLGLEVKEILYYLGL
jgi:hypothetical protein